MRHARTRVLTIVGVVGAVALLGIPTAVQAQLGGMRANIPFDFYIGSQNFPAGQYTLQRTQNDSWVVRVSDLNGHNMVTMTIPITSHSKNLDPELIFNRYGSYNFLSEVRWLGSPSAGQFRKSSLERDFAKNSAPERVAAANLNR